MRPVRDYAAIATRIVPASDADATMRLVVDALWVGLHPTGVSWVGFYLHKACDELVLGPRRDKPACSPIGLHGACGQCFRTGEPIIVTDVKELGENYIACDPRDQSEVVLPMFDPQGRCYGVLDLDSHDLAAFDQRDVDGLERILEYAGLTHSRPHANDSLGDRPGGISAVERERNMLLFYCAIWIPVLLFIGFVFFAC